VADIPAISVGVSRQLKAFSSVNSVTTDVTASTVWTSSNPAVATVSSTGLATGISEGQVTFTATSQGAIGQETYTVVIPGTYAAAFNGGAPKTVAVGAGAANETGQGILYTSDGALMVLGDLGGNIGLFKFDKSGTPISSFGTNGRVVIDLGSYEYPFSFVEHQGRFFIAGSIGPNSAGGDGLVVAVNADGSLDTTFGNSGKVIVDAGGSKDRFYGARFGADGWLYAAGSRNDGASGFLVKMSAQGQLATSFDGDGIVLGSTTGEFAYATADANGNVTVSAYVPFWPPDPALLRYLPSGAPDLSFGINGVSRRSLSTSDDKVRSLCVDSQGRFLAGGWHTNVLSASSSLDACVIRWNANGTLDSTFGVGNYRCLPFGSGGDNEYVRTIEDGGDDFVIVAGSGALPGISQVSAVARLTSSGALDASFGTGGVFRVGNFTTSNAARGVTRDPSTGIMYFAGFVNDPVSGADILIFALNP
jgi:uncharacterized delta-60 repeat protein